MRFLFKGKVRILCASIIVENQMKPRLVLLFLLLACCVQMHAQYRWAYITGTRTTSQTPTYSGFGVKPGSRSSVAAYWADRSGNLWFFGGQGVVSGGAYGYTNELWRLNPDGAVVTFMGGTTSTNSAGNYTGPTYWPSARTG